ncbi:MAG TPA: HAD hydrolase family protein [Candidatus Eisenbacteria bacterium]|nr:HAD hydrolase family protein [Candidatus Eisenbacteria bacterium]
MILSPEELKQRFLKIRLFLADNDAVLTDGRIVFGDYGDELKFFDVQDGHGLGMLRRAGFITVIVSGRKCKVNGRRAADMNIVKLYQNCHDKLKAFEKIQKKFKVSPEEVCYVGDDLIDIPILRRAGVAVAVRNAVPEAKEAAHYVTERSGGRGAVREVCDMLLKAQGRWDEAVKRYYR